MASTMPSICSHNRGPGDPEGYLHPSTPRRLPIYPYPSVMADEDTVLEEAMSTSRKPDSA